MTQATIKLRTRFGVHSEISVVASGVMPPSPQTRHEAEARKLPDIAGRVAQQRAHEQQAQTGEVCLLASDAITDPAQQHRSQGHAAHLRVADPGELVAADVPVLHHQRPM
ncbi:MAG: hypothetical protein WDM77_10725 [Steroidobacteraceae bacterium]